MPHIHAFFPEDQNTRNFLRVNRKHICEVFSRHSGYPIEEIALFPRPIPAADMELAVNVLPLEFVIHTGSKASTQEKSDACAAGFKQSILHECHGAAEIHFGVWLDSFLINTFVEHHPSKAA